MTEKRTWFSIAVLVSLLGVSISPILQNASAWGRFPGGEHPDYHGRRFAPPPRHGDGCVGCGIGIAAVAGLIGGAVIGAEIAGQPAPVYVEPAYVPPPGTTVAALPGGCASMVVNNVQYYQCGPAWYQPLMGGNGVYYSVVPAP